MAVVILILLSRLWTAVKRPLKTVQSKGRKDEVLAWIRSVQGCARETRQREKNSSQFREKRKINASGSESQEEDLSDRVKGFKQKSLILAQDERWRRA